MSNAWSTVETPIGPLTCVISSRGLRRLGLPNEPADEVVASAGGGRHDDGALTDVRDSLDAYFERGEHEFGLDLDWEGVGGDFRRAALAELAAVPFGETITYRELARRAGNERAARAAGHACATNPIAVVVPCHRIVGTDGSLHGFGGGLPMKEWLLRHEGVLL